MIRAHWLLMTFQSSWTNSDLATDHTSEGSHQRNSNVVRRTLHALAHVSEPPPRLIGGQIEIEGSDRHQAVRQRMRLRPSIGPIVGALSGVPFAGSVMLAMKAAFGS
jgi:hypothetical protein